MTDTTASTTELGPQATLGLLLIDLHSDGRRVRIRTADGAELHGVVTNVHGDLKDPHGLVTLSKSEETTYYIPIGQITNVTDIRPKSSRVHSPAARRIR